MTAGTPTQGVRLPAGCVIAPAKRDSGGAEGIPSTAHRAHRRCGMTAAHGVMRWFHLDSDYRQIFGATPFSLYVGSTIYLLGLGRQPHHKRIDRPNDLAS